MASIISFTASLWQGKWRHSFKKYTPMKSWPQIQLAHTGWLQIIHRYTQWDEFCRLLWSHDFSTLYDTISSPESSEIAVSFCRRRQKYTRRWYTGIKRRWGLQKWQNTSTHTHTHTYVFCRRRFDHWWDTTLLWPDTQRKPLHQFLPNFTWNMFNAI